MTLSGMAENCCKGSPEGNKGNGRCFSSETWADVALWGSVSPVGPPRSLHPCRSLSPKHFHSEPPACPHWRPRAPRTAPRAGLWAPPLPGCLGLSSQEPTRTLGGRDCSLAWPVCALPGQRNCTMVLSGLTPRRGKLGAGRGCGRDGQEGCLQAYNFQCAPKDPVTSLGITNSLLFLVLHVWQLYHQAPSECPAVCFRVPSRGKACTL